MSVQIDSLTRRISGRSGKPDQLLLDSVSFTVEDGSFAALVGPSGAGKTTLLRAIAGLDPYQSGHILADGQAMENLSPRERRIGFVFQSYALFRHMTVARNISFGLDILPASQRPSSDEIKRRVEELLELIGLPNMGGAWPHQLSGGQRQRVALARALAIQPRLLLLDEPFGALDPVVRRRVRSWVRDLHERLGLTTILVTHDQDEALAVADFLVVMQNGKVVQTGDGTSLDAHPRTPFILEFLGETLTFPGHCTLQDGQAVFVPDDANAMSFPVSNISPGPAEAMLRPHEMLLVEEKGTATWRSLGNRNGLSRIEARTTEGRHFEVLLPPGHTPPADARVGFDVSKARLFRNGHLLNVAE